MKLSVVALLALLAGLVGCETSPGQRSVPEPPKAELKFIDLPGFDSSLARSLSSALPRVEVGFYDRVTPSALPERVQSWLVAIENGRGTVKVTVLEPEVTNRGAPPILSILSTLWNASKMARELAVRQQYRTAEAYDAEILLKVDGNGQAAVDKILFVQRTR